MMTHRHLPSLILIFLSIQLANPLAAKDEELPKITGDPKIDRVREITSFTLQEGRKKRTGSIKYEYKWGKERRDFTVKTVYPDQDSNFIEQYKKIGKEYKLLSKKSRSVEEALSYNDKGHLVKKVSNFTKNQAFVSIESVTLLFVYDKKGYLVEEKRLEDAALKWTKKARYDVEGRLEWQELPNSLFIHELGLVKDYLKDGESVELSYKYEKKKDVLTTTIEFHKVGGEKLPYKQIHKKTYDSKGRMTSNYSEEISDGVKVYFSEEKVKYDQQGRMLKNERFMNFFNNRQYDNGKLISYTNPFEQNFDQHYRYSKAGRLVETRVFMVTKSGGKETRSESISEYKYHK